MSNEVGNPAVLYASDPARAALNSLFLDTTNGNTPSFKGISGQARQMDLGLTAALDTCQGANVDINSMVPGDLSMPEWDNNQTLAVINQARTESSAYNDAVQLIGTTGTGIRSCFFVAGGTSHSFIIQASEANGKAIKLTFFGTDLATPMSGGAQRFTLTSTELTYTMTTTGFVQGSMYKCQIETSDLGQGAQPFVGRVKVTPSGGTGIFSADFARYRVSGSVFGGTSTRQTWNSNICQEHNSFADVTMITDASALTVEAYTNNPGLSGQLGIMVGGRETTIGATLTDGKVALDTYALPDIPVKAARPVTIRADGWDNASSALAGTPKGTFMRAIYADRRVNMLFRPNTANQRLYIVGTSQERGSSSTIPMWQGWAARMRRRYPGTVVVDAYSGRAFKTDGDTTAKQQALALWIAQSNPTDVYIALGVVDYIAAAWTAATYGTAYAAFLDFLHGFLPNARIYSQSPIAKSVETANGLGDTLGAFRTQISNAATNASRSPWSIFVDGTGANFPAVGDLADGLHPNNLGYGKHGNAVCIAMAAAGAM